MLVIMEKRKPWCRLFEKKFCCADVFLRGSVMLKLVSDITALSMQRNLRDIAHLYGTESSLHAVEEYRRNAGLQSIASVCFKAARISALLIDDGLELDKKHDLNWHEAFIPFVGRILRIERVAEKILDEVRRFQLLFQICLCILTVRAVAASWISPNLCLVYKSHIPW